MANTNLAVILVGVLGLAIGVTCHSVADLSEGLKDIESHLRWAYYDGEDVKANIREVESQISNNQQEGKYKETWESFHEMIKLRGCDQKRYSLINKFIREAKLTKEELYNNEQRDKIETRVGLIISHVMDDYLGYCFEHLEMSYADATDYGDDKNLSFLRKIAVAFALDDKPQIEKVKSLSYDAVKSIVTKAGSGSVDTLALAIVRGLEGDDLFRDIGNGKAKKVSQVVASRCEKFLDRTEKLIQQFETDPVSGNSITHFLESILEGLLIKGVCKPIIDSNDKRILEASLGKAFKELHPDSDSD